MYTWRTARATTVQFSRLQIIVIIHSRHRRSPRRPRSDHLRSAITPRVSTLDTPTLRLLLVATVLCASLSHTFGAGFTPAFIRLGRRSRPVGTRIVFKKPHQSSVRNKQAGHLQYRIQISAIHSCVPADSERSFLVYLALSASAGRRIMPHPAAKPSYVPALAAEYAPPYLSVYLLRLACPVK